jgi:hypothetical protein
LIEEIPVSHHVAAVIGLVGHHHYHSIAGHRIKAFGDGASEAILT